MSSRRAISSGTSDVRHAGSPNRGTKGKPNPKTKMHASRIDVDSYLSMSGEQGALRWPPGDRTALTMKVRRSTIVSYAPAGSGT